MCSRLAEHLLVYLFLEKKMKAKQLILAVTAVVATGSAFAQGNSEWVEFNDFVSTKSRAEVKAELAHAYAQGEIARNAEYVEFNKVASTKPRAQVRAELASDTVRNTEWVEHTNVASTKTRAEVRNEVLQAAKPARAKLGS
ncbi:hypothetical protein GCM10027343_35660 [Noviherbaspirillum agri]